VTLSSSRARSKVGGWRRNMLLRWSVRPQVTASSRTARKTQSISANADGPRDAASRKIDHIAI